MKTAIIISRCSTNEARQDVTRQTQELTKKYNTLYDIIHSFEYYQSGTKNEDMNSTIISFAIKNKIDVIIVSEISRISRKVIQVLQFIERCTQNEIDVVIENYNLHTLNNDKSANTMVQMMLSIGASFATMELQQTKTRLDSGRKKYIENGGILGRKLGSLKSSDKLLQDHSDIVKFLKQGQSVRNVMALTNKSSGTVQKVKQLLTNKKKGADAPY